MPEKKREQKPRPKRSEQPAPAEGANTPQPPPADGSAHRIEWFPTDAVPGAALNPKRHDLAAIARSVRRFGFVSPCVRNETTGRLVAGHGRLDAVRLVKQEGPKDDGHPWPPRGIRVEGEVWSVPVVCGIPMTDEQAAAYVAADNRLSEVGGWDAAELNELLAGFDVSVLDDIGYTAADLRSIEVEALVGHVPHYTDQDPPAQGGSLVDGGPAPAPAGEQPGQGVSGEVGSQIRRVMLYLRTDQYNRAVDLLTRAMEKTGLKNHSEVVVALLEEKYGSAA